MWTYLNLVDDVILPHVSDWLAVDTLQVAKDHMELILEFSDSQLRDIMILAPRVYCESSYHSCYLILWGLFTLIICVCFWYITSGSPLGLENLEKWEGIFQWGKS